MKLKRTIRSGLAAINFMCASVAGAQETLVPDVASLRQRIAATERAADLSKPQKAELVALYAKAISRLELASQFEQEASGYTAALASLPSDLKRLKSEPRTQKLPMAAKALAAQSPAVLEQELLEAVGQEKILQARLVRLQSSLQLERTLQLKQLIATAKGPVKRADATRDAARTEQFQAAEGIAQAAEQRLRLARIEALGQRLASRPARLALSQAEVDQVTDELAAAVDRKVSLQALITQIDKTGYGALAADLRVFLPSLASAPVELRRLAEDNVRLSTSVGEIVAKRQAADDQGVRVDADLASLIRKQAMVSGLLDLGRMNASSAFGAALRQEHDRPTDASDIDQVSALAQHELEQSRIALFQLQERSAPYDLPTAASLLAALGPAAAGWQSTIDTVLAQRRSLITRLRDDQARYADELAALITQLGQFSERSHTYRELLESHLFWIPSAPPMGWQALHAAADSIGWIWKPSHGQAVRKAVATNLETRLSHFTSALLLLIAALLCRGWFKKRLERMAPRIGRVRADRFSLTLLAFGITAILALPPALVLFALAELTHSNTGFARSFETALFAGGIVVLFLELMRQLVRPGGVAALHFGWSPSTLDLVRYNHRGLMVFFVPTVIVMVLLNAQAAPAVRDGLGRIALIVVCGAIVWIAYRLQRLSCAGLTKADGDRGLWYAVHLGYPVLIVLALGMIGLSLLGFHYTAVQLLRLMMQSIWVVTAAVVVHALLKRAFSIYERRLAFARTLARRSSATARTADRDAAERAGDGIPEALQPYGIDRHTISRQTSGLVRLIVFVGVALSLMYVWQGLLPAVRSLDDVVLWRQAASDGSLDAGVVSLWSLVIAIAVVTIGIVAIRNLPGTLEVAILSRLDLAPGTALAVTTLLNYLIAIGGLVAVSNLLGVDWSKLQWLIAALGVGLGFGLQEIVANFVSGIAILFERPFRVGDIVTIAGHTGTVTRIHMRATTISDWDRRELLIPNKAFIVQDCINWTLSDPVTRLTVPVNVAPGTDTDKVVATLLAVARNNKSVCTEPEPAALLLRFGDHRLEFELRVFTLDVLFRSIVTHELHMAIERAFDEQGIDLA